VEVNIPLKKDYKTGDSAMGSISIQNDDNSSEVLKCKIPGKICFQYLTEKSLADMHSSKGKVTVTPSEIWKIRSVKES